VPVTETGPESSRFTGTALESDGEPESKGIQVMSVVAYVPEPIERSFAFHTEKAHEKDVAA
jgi:hypothetical protein